MLHKTIEYPVNTIRRLDHMGHNCLAMHHLGCGHNLKQIGSDNHILTLNIHSNITRNRGHIKLLQCIRYRLCLALKTRTHSTHIRLHLCGGHFLRLIESHIHRKLSLAMLCMRHQVIISPVCNTHSLHPAEPASLNLGIPAVNGIMRHLSTLVLPEPKPGSIDTHAQQESLCERNLIRKELMCNETLSHSLSGSHFNNTPIPRFLGFCRKKYKHIIRD